jgi:hypothetical protein
MKMASSGLYVVVVLCKVSHTVAARSCSTVQYVRYSDVSGDQNRFGFVSLFAI